MEVKPGETVLLDRYEVVRELGEGGMGRVLEAFDRHLERRVAIKLLRDDEMASEAERAQRSARALREARSAAKLSHPGIVQIHDVGELGGAPFLVMELVEGKSLREHPELSVAEKLRVLLDVTRALEAAHAGGIVHRDVKPDNVMVRPDGAVKVLDFGIARRTDAAKSGAAPPIGTLTAQGIRVGTPAYMSPEQIRGDGAGEPSDQFSWGVLAYELLTGRVPWKATDPLTLVASILADEPKSLRREGASIDPAVEAVIQRTLAKDPSARFASMRALREALEHALVATGPTTASSPPPPAHRLTEQRSPDDAERETPSVQRVPKAARAPAPTTDFKRYSTQEMQEILERALRTPAEQRTGYSRADIVEAAREVGIDEDAVRAAARTIGGADLQAEYHREQWHGLYRHAGAWAVVFVCFGIFGLTVKGDLRMLTPMWFWLMGVGIHAMGVLFPKAPTERQLHKLQRKRDRDRGERRYRVEEPELQAGVRVLLETASERRALDEAAAEDDAAVAERQRRRG